MIEKALRDFGDLTSLHETLRRLPPSAPTGLVLDALLHLLKQDDTKLGAVVTTLEKQKPALLALLERRLSPELGPRALFLFEYLRIAGANAWPAALEALLSIRAVGRSARGRKTAQVLAKAPAAVTACVALVSKAEHDWMSENAIAVLIFAEGDLPLDALAPIVDELHWIDLELIEKWAPKDSPVAKLVSTRERARRASSPAVQFARHLGLAVDAFDLNLQLRTEGNAHFLVAVADSNGPWFQCTLTVPDPALPRYAWPATSAGHFGAQDKLGVGIPTPETLDVWFRAATAKLSLTWLWEDARLRTNVRGKARQRLLAWLRGT